jgi:predicted ATPase
MHPLSLRLANVGPIKGANVDFGELTVLVGPQATGKSILLQLLRLVIDTGPILRMLRKYGLDWKNQGGFLDVYLGEGTRGLWTANSSLNWRGQEMNLAELVRRKKRPSSERTFFIPAQRVLALSRDGWLRPFTDYKAGDPYAVRDFSERLRELMESGLGRGRSIFPQPKRLKDEIRKMISRDVFHGFQLDLDQQGPQKRLVLRHGGAVDKLPYMVWSAGQREFVPLLLGLYWLLPPTQSRRRGKIEWVIIEELEMGLHPRAIRAMLFIVLDLLWRGYRVCLSTHSPQVLDLVWALRALNKHGASPPHVFDLFELKPRVNTQPLAEKALSMDARVYAFDLEGGTTHDISELDPEAKNSHEAGWGGLTGWSGHITDVVTKVVAGGPK